MDLARVRSPPHRILVRRRRGLRGVVGKLLFSSLHSSVLVLPNLHLDKEGLEKIVYLCKLEKVPNGPAAGCFFEGSFAFHLRRPADVAWPDRQGAAAAQPLSVNWRRHVCCHPG